MFSRLLRFASGVLFACVGVLLVCVTLTIKAPDSSAWHRYRGGCQTCHGDFQTVPYQPIGGGVAWPDSLHEVHAGAGYMNSACGLCHRSDDEGNPWLRLSDGTATAPGIGCLGCHGRVVPGELYPTSSGLITRHLLEVPSDCQGCHPPVGIGVPLPEWAVPAYYGLPDTLVDSPCNDDASGLEDWSGDGVGLDNDGDGVADASDLDCVVDVCGNNRRELAEICDGQDLGANDCASIGQGFSGGVLGCLPDCTGWEVTECGVCGDGIVQPPEVCDGSTLADQDCVSIGQGFTAGTLACRSDCGDWDTSGCGSSVCGNGVVEPGETCDPIWDCPTYCDAQQACTRGTLHGSASTCDASCSYEPIASCVDGDGCCPAGCDSQTDSDCGAQDGCGCSSNSESRHPDNALILILGLLFIACRRRRRGL
ncbi:MAG: hypothetical protein ABI333_27560 [bacterium]